MKANWKIEDVMSHGVLRSAFERYNEVWSRHKEYPYLNYMGMNFDADGIYSIKFYFHLFHELIENEVLKFLPHTKDFNNYYHLHAHSKFSTPDYSGCAFEVKFVRGETEPNLGFFCRLTPTQEAFQLAGKPRKLPFDLDNGDVGLGINYEYHSNGSVKRKKYFYLKGEMHKAYFARRFGYDFLNSAAMIEYAESDETAKINTYFGRHKLAPEEAFLFPAEQRKMVDDLVKNMGLVIKGLGYYENSDVKSAYFFEKDGVNPYEGIENSTSDYNDTYERMLRFYENKKITV